MAKDTAKNTENTGGSKKKLIIIIAVITVLLIGVGIGAYLFLSNKEPELTPEQEQALMERQAKEVGPMVNIESFIVNIMDDAETRYLKAAITLEVETPAVATEVNQRMPQIKDSVLLHVGNKTFSELNDLQGRLQLRAELLNKINSLLLNGSVKRIYFTDFVVQ